MSGLGWLQWAPGQKYHHMTQDDDGYYGTACGAWRATGFIEPLQEDVPEKKKCKLCIRALQRSETTEAKEDA